MVRTRKIEKIAFSAIRETVLEAAETKHGYLNH